MLLKRFKQSSSTNKVRNSLNARTCEQKTSNVLTNSYLFRDLKCFSNIYVNILTLERDDKIYDRLPIRKILDFTH